MILWIILEFVFLFLYWNLPDRFKNGKRIVEINLGRENTVPASIVPHPYMLYANNPNYEDSMKQHNSRGYRGEEFAIEKDPDVIRILTLGGSTTYGYLNKNAKRTWPAVLQGILQQGSAKKIEVINGGQNYGTSAELLASYVFRHRYINPDIIIFHEGGNDAIPVLFPDYNAEYTHFRGHGSGSSLRKFEKVLLHSNIFKVFYSLWLNTYETVYRAQPFSLDKLDRKEAAKRVEDDKNFEGFKRNLELLIRLSEMDNSQMVLFGFVQAREQNLSRKRKDYIGLEKAVIQCVAKNKAIMEKLASQYGALYIEAPQDSFRDEWFIDNCHLTPAGEIVKAQVVADHIMPLILQLNNNTLMGDPGIEINLQ